MTRLATLIAFVLALGACNKPSAENCRKALGNMQRLLGTEHLVNDAELEGEVRRCKGGSTRKAVECAIGAQTLEDLKNCKFYKGPLPSPIAGSAGSAAGSAGSAVGSEVGSAGSAAAGAAGSAAAGAAGSNAPGSAGGSAAGSAAAAGSG